MFRLWSERPMPEEFAPLLEGVAVVSAIGSDTPDDMFSAVADVEGIIASAGYYTAEMMDRAPQVRVISRTGIGYDRVSVEAATERGIVVCNAPDGPTISTAEHAIALMLGVAKKIKLAEHNLRHTDRQDFYGGHFGLELYGTTLGLIGIGRIGGHVATVALALGMQVRAYDPFVPAGRAADLGVELMPDLESLLGEADVVSVHVPLMAETRHMINAETIARMKPGAILVNTARGGLVDEAALLAALDSGQLSGAGLDVTDPEPPERDNPLLHRHEVIVTPHVASATTAGKSRIYRSAIEQALQVLRDERPPNVVNPAVWERRRRADS